MLCLGSWGFDPEDMPKTFPELIEQVNEMYQNACGTPEASVMEGLHQLAQALDEKANFASYKLGE
jgi:hypothetical protein